MHLVVRKLAPLAVAAAVGGSLLLVGSPASAEPGDGAFVIKEFGCVANNPGAPFLFSNDKTQAVITPSGNTKLTCHFEGAPVAEAVNLSGVGCGTFLGFTTDSHFVYTKSGHGTLTCQLKASS